MSKFNRPSTWLRHLFTPRQTSAANPGEVSNDVSLNQPFDGGGYPLLDPTQWASVVVSATIAVDNTELLTTGPDEIIRILAISARLNAGVAPSAFIKVGPSTGTVPCSPTIAALTAERQALISNCPILGPSATLFGRHFGGDAATIVEWGIYMCRAPLGSVFYV